MPTYATPTFITEVLHLDTYVVVLNEYLSEFIDYTALAYSY